MDFAHDADQPDVRPARAGAELKATQIDTLTAFIDDNARVFRENGAAARNFKRWPIFGLQLGTNAVVTGTYKGEVGYLKSWLVKRIAWMDANR